MKRFVRLLAVTALAVGAGITSAHATEPRLIGTFGDWSAYVFMENDNKVCYMASRARKAEGNYTRRGDEYALVTHRPAENTRNVFSYIAGYSYKPGSEATVAIGGQTFNLFTQDDTAWAADAAADDRISEAIRKGSSMTVKGTSSRGTATTDTYSLSGSGDAHDAITKECAQ